MSFPEPSPARSRAFRLVAVALFPLAVGALVAACDRDAAPEPAPAAAPATAPTAGERREHALRHARGYVCPMHPQVRSDAPGECPICGMDLVPVEAPQEAAGDATAVPSGIPVTVPAAMQQALGVRLATAERGSLPRHVEGVARVEFDQRGAREVRVRAEGWVEALHVRAAGDRVRAGDPLFAVFSPKLSTSREDLERARRLGDPELVAAAEARLKALGAAGGGAGRTTFRAPIDGVVAELAVQEGAMVTPDMMVLRILPIGRVWVVASVPESRSAGLAPGAPAVLRFGALPGERIEAKVAEVLPELDTETRTVQARLVLDNAGTRLRPGMVGVAEIGVGGAEPVVHVPLDAVIRTGRQDRVVVAQADGRFVAREVVVGVENGERVEIRSGVAPGERVVVSGQFLIDSESSARAAFGRMADGAPPPPAAPGPHAGHGGAP